MSDRWTREIRSELVSYLLDNHYRQDALSQAAARWVAGGVDAPEVVDLAGLSTGAPTWEVRVRASAVMQRFGVPTLDDARERQRVALILIEMLQHTAEVRRCSSLLRSLADRFYDDEYLEGLGELLGLASSWDEPWADQIPSAIKVAAEEYLKAFRTD